MTFYKFMINKYLDKDSPKGDLAKDMKVDKDNFPKDGRREKIESYLRSKNACYECLMTFDKAWEEYSSC